MGICNILNDLMFIFKIIRLNMDSFLEGKHKTKAIIINFYARLDLRLQKMFGDNSNLVCDYCI